MPGIALANVQVYLTAAGLLGVDGLYPDVKVIRGLGSDPQELRRGSGRLLILSRGAGPGFMTEQAFDRPIVTLRAVGRQNDYDDAETFADAADKAMLAESTVMIGAQRALFVTRTGGAPAVVTIDAARRTHFSCSYVIPVASGL